MQSKLAASLVPIEEQPHYAFPVLVGDIGGTNARFAIIDGPNADARTLPILHTADFPTIDAAIRENVLPLLDAVPKTAILAVAGPIDGDEIDLTNAPWVVRPKVMIAELGFSDVVVINDFEAQALAVAFIDDENREKIGGRDPEAHASRLVLGPGTGLGVAGLVNARHIWIPVPGEGGHVDVGPRTARDRAIFPHLEAIGGRISAEQLLCGRGIVNIYTAIARADGRDPQARQPKEITAAALEGADAGAVETVSLFATYLGRLAGDLALVFMARGGVYIGGGIAQKIMAALKKPEFRAGFEDKAPHQALLAEIPTYVLTHPLAALSGLSTYARSPMRFGLSTDGRRWQA
ncbi:glucokinase [Pararhizobium mangrovi]|uniref:Glucokinase n=1 Tax=Pararhizobium mangrovi TaxID=2590452 RepID=A0A506TZT3_9HYPH|nr:glucokinase [Pararhizobium mangrovi]TPW26481.1 glucokinase [Pararhizobium mangrovi]